MKKIISGLLAGAMMLSGVSAMASDINITIDNEEFIPKNALGEAVEPFIENGSTYLPVRAMGEAVGKTVAFDAENYAVYIGEEPDEADKTREPALLVGDKVFYEDTVKALGTKYLINGERMIKLAKSIASEEEINQHYDAMLVMIADLSAYYDRETLEYLAYSQACNEVLMQNNEFMANVMSNIITVKHILVEDEAVANEIIEKLNSDAAFEDLIEEYNTDPGQTRESSYTFSYGEMVEEFEKAAFELKEDEISLPVKSAFGYHVIKRLPLDSKNMADDTYETAFEKEWEKADTGRIVLVRSEGDYGKINSVVYNTDMLRRINSFYRGESEDFLCSDAFEIATTITMINNMARSKGIVDDQMEHFDLDYELALFAALYEAMFEGKLEFSDEEITKASEEIEIEIFSKIKVFVDGKLIVPCDVNNNYVEPKNVDGTVFVPVRAIVEALGMKADWDNDTRTVVITK